MSKKSKLRKGNRAAESSRTKALAGSKRGKKNSDSSKIDRFSPLSSKKKKAILIAAISLLVVFLFVLVLFIFTPLPAVLKVKLSNAKSTEKLSGEAKKLLDSDALVTKDISYNSKFSKGTLDVYRPSDNENSLPTLIWVHGGFYAGGDKSHTEYFCRSVSKYGYSVVSVNYNLLPSAKYPEPLIQLGEAYEFLKANKETYKLDPAKIFMGGDSVGAQIVAQFANIQTNPSYGDIVGINGVMPKEHLRGLFLISGLYDFTNLGDYQKSEGKYDINRIGWGYFGDRRWQEKTEAKYASVANYVNGAFPPTFLSDGQKSPLRYQSDSFANILQDYNIKMTKMMFSESLETDYNFIYDIESDNAQLAIQEISSKMHALLVIND